MQGNIEVVFPECTVQKQCWEKCCFALLYSVAVNFLFLPFRRFCNSDDFLPDPHLPSLLGYIMSLSVSLCRSEAVTHPSGVCLQRHWPPNPESYVTMAIPKLEHGAWKEGGAYSFTYSQEAARLMHAPLTFCVRVCVCSLCARSARKKKSNTFKAKNRGSDSACSKWDAWLQRQFNCSNWSLPQSA